MQSLFSDYPEGVVFLFKYLVTARFKGRFSIVEVSRFANLKPSKHDTTVRYELTGRRSIIVTRELADSSSIAISDRIGDGQGSGLIDSAVNDGTQLALVAEQHELADALAEALTAIGVPPEQQAAHTDRVLLTLLGYTLP